ncbi:MAG: hypothetical protein IH624_17325 [Phycisphaerae bacterium]|nr:hypothetical protein [Phycisphaerae bacterium]
MGHLLAMVDEEVVFTAMFAAAAVLVIGFGTVLLVKSVPSKLILLGLLLAVAAVLAGGFLHGMGALTLTLLILAVLIILAGVFCLVIGFIVQTFRRSPTEQK